MTSPSPDLISGLSFKENEKEGETGFSNIFIAPPKKIQEVGLLGLKLDPQGREGGVDGGLGGVDGKVEDGSENSVNSE